MDYVKKGDKQSKWFIEKRMIKIRGRKTGKFFNCYWCKKEIYRYPRDLKYKNHFCSRNCLYSFSKDKTLINRGTFKRGKLSPNWKGGIYQERLKSGYYKRDTMQLSKWRKKVYKRDKWLCQLCNKKCHKDICAHHIFFYEQFPKVRFYIRNGITVCFKCHKFIHKYTKIKSLLNITRKGFLFNCSHNKYREILFQLLGKQFYKSSPSS